MVIKRGGEGGERVEGFPWVYFLAKSFLWKEHFNNWV